MPATAPASINKLTFQAGNQFRLHWTGQGGHTTASLSSPDLDPSSYVAANSTNCPSHLAQRKCDTPGQAVQVGQRPVLAHLRNGAGPSAHM